jgi:hypothetical protein
MWRAINYYQRGGWGLALVSEPGFRGSSSTTISRLGCVSHFNIATIAGFTPMSCAK